uniref:M n=1 Tax=Suaeda salsa virus 1 TaxID=2793741 RepID=A0A8D9PGV1_9RHAB|nr:TPA_asm: M [Suaeda salsa virus 1]
MSHWMGISITYNSASLAYDGEKSKAPPKGKELGALVKPLLMSAGAGAFHSEVLRAMIEKGVVNTYTDQYVSPYFGPRTPRLNLVFPKMIIIPVDFPVIPERALIQAVGKRTSVGNRKYISDISLDIITKEINGNDIPQLLVTNKSWFHGELPLVMDQSSKAPKQK